MPARKLFDDLPIPAIVLSPYGQVIARNAASASLINPSLTTDELRDVMQGDSARPVIIRAKQNQRGLARRIMWDDVPAALVIQHAGGGGNFALMSDKMRELEDQLVRVQDLSEELTLVFETTPAPMCLLAGLDTPLRWNRAFSDLMGLDAGLTCEAALDNLRWGVHAPLMAKTPDLAEAAGLIGPTPFEGALVIDEEIIPVDICLTATRDRTRRMALLTLRDLRQSRRFAAAQERARALELADNEKRATEAGQVKFLQSASHQLRTPLSAIRSALDLLSSNPAIRDLDARALDILATATAQGEAVIARMLSASHQDAKSEVSTFSPVQALRDATKRVKKGRVTLDTRADSRLTITADRAALDMVLDNLLDNAVTHGGGTARLGLSITPDGSDALVEITITDNGDGLPEALTDGPRLAEGLGIGLRLVDDGVDRLDGEVMFGKAKSGGARIDVAFAAQIAEAPIRDQIVRKVLVVDDHEMNREVVSMMLARCGHSATLAAGGAEAIAMAQAESFDLILMDLSMPGVDGFAAARAIRQLAGHARTRMIALTAHDIDDVQADCLTAGFDGVLSKPIRQPEIMSLLSPVPAPAVETAQAAPDGFLDRFITECRSEFRRGYARILMRDAAGAEAIFHKMLGGALILNVQPMGGILQKLEKALKASDWKVVEATYQQANTALLAMTDNTKVEAR